MCGTLALPVLPSSQGHSGGGRTLPRVEEHSQRPTYCCRLAHINCAYLARSPILLPANLINNYCNSGGRRRGGRVAAAWSGGPGGGPRSGQRLQRRLPLARTRGLPGLAARRGAGGGGASRRAPAPPPAPALPVPSPARAARVFKVGRQPREPDIRERLAALLRRPLRSLPALLSRPYNPRQCPETVWSSQPPRPPAPGVF